MNNKFLIVGFILLFSFTFISAEEFGYNYLTKDISTLDSLTNVLIINPINTQVLIYNSSSGLWYNSYLNDSGHSVNNSLLWNGNAYSDTRWLNIDGSNANQNIDIGSYDFSATNLNLIGNLSMNDNFIKQVGVLNFNITSCTNTDDMNEGDVCWNPDQKTLNVIRGNGQVIQVGKELGDDGRNVDSVDIADGSLVCWNGFQGDNPTFIRADASNVTLSAHCGILTIDCPINELCPVTIFGFVNNINTSQWINGQALYSDPNVLGGLTTERPLAWNDQYVYGKVGRISETVGTIFATKMINPENGFLINNIYSTGNITALNFFGGDGFFDNIYNSSQVDELIGGASLQLYFKNTTSGISNYWNMNQIANGRLENSTSITLSADSTLIGSFISPNASDLGIAGLDEGIIDSHFHASVDAVGGKKTVNGYFEVYKRLSNSTEILLSISHLVEVTTTSESEYEAHSPLSNEIVLNLSDRIVVKLYANLSGSGGNPTLTIYIQGDTLSRADFSSLGVNFATKGDLESYVPYTGAIKNLDLGSQNLTTTGNGFFNWLGSLTNKITKIFTQDIEISGKINLTNGTYSNQIYTNENGTLVFYLP